MAPVQWLLVICGLASLLAAGARAGTRSQVYVVYMGAVPPRTSPNLLQESHLRLVSTVLKRGRRADNVVVRQYKHGFSGFAARLSEAEAAALRRNPGVVSVFPDPVYQLHTTRSWDFLQQTAVKIDATAGAGRRGGAHARHKGAAAATADSPPADTIIGLLDTGIWPESPSFDDTGFGPVPTRWNGTCMAGDNFNSTNCNKKLIGARYYNETDVRGPSGNAGGGSARDDVGHGTHTSSTAAGSAVSGASYYGLASGTAKGGSAASRVAMYRVCSAEGCSGSAILAGFDDAVADGVDVLSVSLGASPYFRPDFSEDPIAIGSFHAVSKGVAVVCSAGNSGPAAATVVNAAPWILTVAATTIDRDFESDVLLGGNNSAVKGGAINFSNLDKSPKYPLITGASAKSSSVSDADSASHCEPGTLDNTKIQGKIVLCNHSEGDTSKPAKADELKDAGAAGAIFVNDVERAVATTYLDFPATEVTSAAAAAINKYIASASQPVATITPTATVTGYKPAPVVAYFSSRGPSAQTGNILKPDVAAPGVNILASWIPTPSSSSLPPGQKEASQFKLVSGTSMACPHVAGAAATVRAWNPTWSPAAIRSAIMTTGKLLTNQSPNLRNLNFSRTESQCSVTTAGSDAAEQRRSSGDDGRRVAGDAVRPRGRAGAPGGGAGPGARVRGRGRRLPRLPLQLRLRRRQDQARRRRHAWWWVRLRGQRHRGAHLRPQLPVDRRVGARKSWPDGGPRRHQRRGGGGGHLHGRRRRADGVGGEGHAEQAGVHQEREETGVPGELLRRERRRGEEGRRHVRLRYMVGWEALGSQPIRGDQLKQCHGTEALH
ncbi:unnamed protein product [Urochloa humidicola]